MLSNHQHHPSSAQLTGEKTSGDKGAYLTDNRGLSNPIQRKANNTGLPDNLKSGIENLSGHSMDDVKVHYNSSAPAQLNAHAYAQGNQIHVAPGQEKHVPHEAWHVVQQKQGRVRPTMQMKAISNEVVQRIAIGGEEKSVDEIIQMLRDDEAVQWHDQYVPILHELQENAQGDFKTIHDLLLRVAGIMMAEYRPDEKGYDADVEDNAEAVRPLKPKRFRKHTRHGKQLPEAAVMAQHEQMDHAYAAEDPANDADVEENVEEARPLKPKRFSKHKRSQQQLPKGAVMAEHEQKEQAKEGLSLEHVIATHHIFGLKSGAFDPAHYALLYRSVERAELLGLIQSINATGKPNFEHKGKSKGRAEKFFGPNKAYVVESMGDKGKRSWLMEIVLAPDVRQLIYNPDNTGLDASSVGTPGYEMLSKEKAHEPKAITIKTETPKEKKGKISYASHNVGFRKEAGLLKEFSSYIVGINLVDKKYNIKEVRKSL